MSDMHMIEDFKAVPSCADCKHYLTNPEDEPCRLCFGYTRFEKKKRR